MKIYTKKYIITGAPGTGKTTLIDKLGEEFSYIPEISRMVIKSEQEKGGNGMPWEDLDKFVALVCEASLAKIESNPHALFSDRSILDLIAYLEVEGKTIPSSIDNFPFHHKFEKKVFFAPTWRSIYQKDAQRPQEFDYCVALEKALEANYIKRGFDIIRLPKDTILIRVNFIHTFLKTLHIN